MARGPRLPEPLVAIAMVQRGLLTTSQVLEVMSRKALDGLRTDGVIDRQERGVYRLVGSPTTFAQRAMLAVLAFGPPVAISHGSAARMWGFAELGHGALDVTLPDRRSGWRSCATVHRGALGDGEVVVRHGMPVTAPVRTMRAVRLRREKLDGKGGAS